MSKKSRKKTVNNELRVLVITTLLFVFLVPVGMLVIITIQDHHAQDDYATEVDGVEMPEGEIDGADVSDETNAEETSEDAVDDASETAPSDEVTTGETETAPAPEETEAAPAE